MAVTSGTFAGFEQATAITPWTSVNVTIASGCTRVDVLIGWEAVTLITSVTLNGATMQVGPTGGPSGANQFVRHYYMDSADAGWPGTGTFAVVVTPAAGMSGYIGVWPLHGAAAGAANRNDPRTSATTTSLAPSLASVPAGAGILSGCNWNSLTNPTVSGGSLRFADNGASGGHTSAFGDSFPSSAGTITHTWTSGNARCAALMVEILAAAVAAEGVGTAAGAGVGTAASGVVSVIRTGAGTAAGSGAATAPGSRVLSGVGTAAGAGAATATATSATRLQPDAILLSTNLTGAVTAIDENPTAPGGDWLTATLAALQTILRVSFGSPGGTLQAGADLQTFRAYVRKTAGTPNPTLTLQLYEDGGLVDELLTGTSITSTTGQLVTATWDADLLAAISGANVELRLVGDVGSTAGSPGALPAFAVAGGTAGSSFSGTTDHTVAAAPVVAGNVHLVFVAFIGGSNRTLNSVAPNTWTILGPFGGSSDPIQVSIAYREVESSAEGSGNLTLNLTGTSTTYVRSIGRLTATDGFASPPLQAVSSVQQASGATAIAMPPIDITAANQRAFAYVATSVNAAIAAATGESGGDWGAAGLASNLPIPAAVSLQTSDQSGGGDISGGTATWTGSGNALSVGFAVVPAAVMTPVNTVEFGAVDWLAALSAAEIESGVGLAAGVGAASAVGRETSAAAGSAAGAGAATGAGAPRGAGVGSGQGAGVATGVGAPRLAGAASAAATGAAVAVGRSIGTGVGSTAGAGTAVAIGALVSSYLPNTVLATSNLKDTSLNIPPTDLSDIQDDPQAPDSDWWTAVNPTLDIEARIGLQTPGGNLVTAQAFEIYVRKTAGTGNPTLDVQLYENGVLVTTLVSGVSVTSTGGQLVTVPWDASLLTDPSGVNAEIRLVGTAAA